MLRLATDLMFIGHFAPFMMRERERDRDRETETDRDRQRQTETDRDRQRQRQRDRETERQMISLISFTQPTCQMPPSKPGR